MFDELLNPHPSVVNQALEAIAPIVEVFPPVNVDSTSSPSSTTVEQDAPSTSNSTTPTETQSLIIPQDVGDDNLDIEVAHMGSDSLFEPKTYKEALTQSCWIEAMQEELNEFERLEVWELVPRPDKMSMMGKISFFLGLQISQNPRGIFINQSKYALESLKKYGFESCEPVDTQMVEKSKLDEDKEGKVVDPSHYREYQLADLFTKALGMDKIEFVTNKLGMRSFAPETLKKLMNGEDETMVTTIEQQVALDEAFVPSAQRLRIGRINFRLPSDIHSKESTLQVVYDVLRQSPFFKAFLVTADHIVDLEAFREMLHISLRISGQSFAELPFEDEILEFLSLRLSQAQILWGLYHRRNVDYAFLIWEDLVYQVEHKNQKKSNEIYYPRFTKVSIHHFMMKKPSIPRRNRVNWHYVRDDVLFSTIKVVSRHQTTQQYGAILHIELTTADIKNTKAYKEYYACATGEAAPKPKASARKKKGGSASSTTPPTSIATPTPTTIVVAAPRLSAAAKGKQPARARSPTEPSDVERTEAEQLKIVLKRSRHEMNISQQGGSSTDEGTGSKPGVPDVPSDDSEEELSWNSSDDEDVDMQTKGRDESEGEKTDESDDDDDDQEEAEKVNDDDDNEEEVPKIDEHETTTRVIMKPLKVIGKVRMKRQGNRKRRVLIQFLELLKKVRMMTIMRSIK
nr:retrovirus-related Pol polyprotein from transposon TNT 1-94 [Tanacetum cinerariifolium]